MQQDEMAKFAGLMNGVAEYYGKGMSKQIISIYWRSLANDSYRDVSSAFTRHMSDPDTGQFMPKIADIRKYIDGNKESQSMGAWTKLDKAIRKIGPWQSVCFDDPIINQVVVDMGGWISLCETPTEKDLEFRMHEFNKRYKAYVLRGGVSEHPRRLTGHTEATNSRNGHKSQCDVLLLGNESNAMRVYENGSETKTLTVSSVSDVIDKVKPTMLEAEAKRLKGDE